VKEADVKLLTEPMKMLKSAEVCASK